MTSIKCRQCGLVTASTHPNCKTCGKALHTSSAGHSSSVRITWPRALLIAGAVLVLILAVAIPVILPRVVSPTLARTELTQLLYAENEVKKPVTARLVTRLEEVASHDNLDEDSLIENYYLARVLKASGLATIEFKSVKSDRPRCAYFDGGPVVAVPLPDGGVKMVGGESSETCSDAWHYYTDLKIEDPTTVDKTLWSEKLSAVRALGEPPLVPTRQPSSPTGSSTLQIGSLEIVELSDLVPLYYKNTYIVGFKFRFKTNVLGELFDRASQVHNALPERIQKQLVDENPRDLRFSYRQMGIGSDELTQGYAILRKEGWFKPNWKITHVAFNSGHPNDDKFVFRPVESFASKV